MEMVSATATLLSFLAIYCSPTRAGKDLINGLDITPSPIISSPLYPFYILYFSDDRSFSVNHFSLRKLSSSLFSFSIFSSLFLLTNFKKNILNKSSYEKLSFNLNNNLFSKFTAPMEDSFFFVVMNILKNW